MRPFIFDDPSLNKLDPLYYKDVTSHNLDLNGTTYSMRDLGFLIENGSLCLRSILHSQSLTSEFCVKYMRNCYASGDGDSDITSIEILAAQPHIHSIDLSSPVSKN